MTESEICVELRRMLKEARAEFEEAGGNHLNLANKIDRIQYALDSLEGRLCCPHCESDLTGH